MFFEGGDRCGLWRLVQKKTNATNGTFRGLKGHESIAQASAWVYISSETALKLKGGRNYHVAPGTKYGKRRAGLNLLSDCATICNL